MALCGTTLAPRENSRSRRPSWKSTLDEMHQRIYLPSRLLWHHRELDQRGHCQDNWKLRTRATGVFRLDKEIRAPQKEHVRAHQSIQLRSRQRLVWEEVLDIHKSGQGYSSRIPEELGRELLKAVWPRVPQQIENRQRRPKERVSRTPVATG